MKKIIFIFLVGIFLSCSSNSDNNDVGTNSITGIWRFKMDGVQYQWINGNSDPLTPGSGSSTFLESSSMTEIDLYKTSDPIFNFTFKIPTLNTGTYLLNNFNAALTDYSGTIVTYYTNASNIITLNITEINNNVTPNIIKGTFSGKLRRENNQGVIIVKNISESYFEAVRE
ncbi:hypothetical protein [Flavobacterium sp.]|uniref:hypothetical protein n=1 Tax=Flavobacterium sp. TaxID=239 RepID=UPI0033423147